MKYKKKKIAIIKEGKKVPKKLKKVAKKAIIDTNKSYPYN